MVIFVFLGMLFFLFVYCLLFVCLFLLICFVLIIIWFVGLLLFVYVVIEFRDMVDILFRSGWVFLRFWDWRVYKVDYFVFKYVLNGVCFVIKSGLYGSYEIIM